MSVAAPVRAHVHVYIHVASHDWAGKPALVCKCACGDTLTAEEIKQIRAEMGLDG